MPYRQVARRSFLTTVSALFQRGSYRSSQSCRRSSSSGLMPLPIFGFRFGEGTRIVQLFAAAEFPVL
jgi:hypothetical protein